MNLYIMRHANAGVPKKNPLLDTKRALVKEGKQQCMLMAGVLTALKAQVDVIISSPLKRSQQSAQFVATEIGFEARIVTSPALAPDADYAAFQQLIAQYAERDGVLVVGHNPNLAHFLAKLISGNGNGNGHGNGDGNGHGPVNGSSAPKIAGIRLRKAAIARVDMSRRPPQLQWMIDPRLARTIYASVTKSSRPKTSRK
jgi:phosphohistidine phosphatase